MNSRKKVLFIDRDGTLIKEPPVTFQVDTLQQMEFLPGVIRNLYLITQRMDFELVMVSNQDGLGTDANPTDNFNTVQAKLLQVLEGEDIKFDAVFIDNSYENDRKPTRKPGTAMLAGYMNGDYDLGNSWVIGDRMTDAALSANLGAKAILIGESNNEPMEGVDCTTVDSWDGVYKILSV